MFIARNRLYHATVGAWLTRDPIGTRSSRNIYEYVLSHPLSLVDPLGLQGMPWLYPPGTYLYGPPPIRPRPPTDCEKFDKWYQAESSGPTSWMFYLPKCPCQLTKSKKCDYYYAGDGQNNAIEYESFDKPGPEWSTPTTPTGKAKYHPNADVCIRAASRDPKSSAGQQCCYDAKGKLITDGPSAGTPDRYAPDDLIGFFNHLDSDVTPFDWALACDGGSPGAAVAKYLKVRPPMNGNKCPSNK